MSMTINNKSKIKSALEGAILNANDYGSKIWTIEVSKLQDAFNLIIELEEEINQLEAEVDKQYEQAKADILGNMSDGGTSCHWCIEQHRMNAFKEFAQMLNMSFGNYSDDTVIWVRDKIDDILKKLENS